ncbi:MAG: ectonucleotide pyrophosphatase/phosphodiesterase [Gemmatimonadales bacterium]|nr:ectonucleotide pyrophosphatase/phosphodiesterase [Gemmatimonadales bacterium]
MRRLAPVLAFAAAACAGVAPGGAPAPAAAPQAVVLVSLDGFRADYLDRGVSPNLAALAARGVRAEWLEASFPTKTFPNHWTLVTGLIPDHHGVVGNTMRDAALGSFSMSKLDAVRDGRWWGGEPIWATAERQGMRTAAMFWPGSESDAGGVRPSRWLPFDDRFPNAARVDSVLAWLTRPGAEAARLVTLYYSDVDHAGHDEGPDGPGVPVAIARVDSMIGRLVAGLAARGLTERVNIVVVSDHGMAASGADRLIRLDDYVSLEDVDVVDWTPVGMLQPKPGREQAVERALRGAHPHLRVYRRDELPPAFRFGKHPRVTALVLVADEGWNITTRERAAKWAAVGGTHGYDQRLPSMHAIFVAAGPGIRRGARVPGFANVHVYPLLAHLLGLRPAPTDGSLDAVRGVLPVAR